MLQSLFNSTSIPLLEQVARFSEHRQRALASNIANIDTPNYRPRDLPVDEFRQALQDFVETGKTSRGATISGTATAAAEPFFPEELFQPSLAPARNVTFHDGANRSIEAAVMEMTKNTGMQRFAIEVMTAQLNLLQSVISERV